MKKMDFLFFVFEEKIKPEKLFFQNSFFAIIWNYYLKKYKKNSPCKGFEVWCIFIPVPERRE